MTNHPIYSKITLKPKATFTISRKFSKFSLNNKKGTVELRYPNGKVADKVKYDKGAASIREGEVYEETKLGWAWKNTLPINAPVNTNQLAVVSGESNPAVLGASDFQEFPDEMRGRQSESRPRRNFREVFAEIIFTPHFAVEENRTQSRPVLDLAILFF